MSLHSLSNIHMPQPLIKFRFNPNLNSWQMYGFLVGQITRTYRWIAVHASTVEKFMEAKRAEIITMEQAQESKEESITS